jgi:hypothetical protein
LSFLAFFTAYFQMNDRMGHFSLPQLRLASSVATIYFRSAKLLPQRNVGRKHNGTSGAVPAPSIVGQTVLSRVGILGVAFRAAASKMIVRNIC